MRETATPGKPFGRRLYFDEGEIDRICADALASVGCLPATPSPIEIELFLEKRFACEVAYENLKPGVLGFAVFGAGGAVEVVGAERSLFDDGTVGARRAWATLAHEAGHGLLHAKLFSEGHERHPLLDGSFDYKRRRIMCRKEDLRMGAGGYDGKWWEWQANQAIGGLLLPEELVRACVEPLTEERGSWGARELPAPKRHLAARRVGATFDVNPAVARIRLNSLFPPVQQLSL